MDIRNFIIIFIFHPTASARPIAPSFGRTRVEIEPRVERRAEDAASGISVVGITLGSIIGALILLLIVRKLYDRTKRGQRRKVERLADEAGSVLNKMQLGDNLSQSGDGAVPIPSNSKTPPVIERMDRMLQHRAHRSEDKLADELEQKAAATDAGMREDISDSGQNQTTAISIDRTVAVEAEDPQPPLKSQVATILRKLSQWPQAAESKVTEAQRLKQAKANSSRATGSQHPKSASTPMFSVAVFQDGSQSMRLDCSSHIVDTEHPSVHKLGHIFRMPGPGSMGATPELWLSQQRICDFETEMREDYQILNDFHLHRTPPRPSPFYPLTSHPSPIRLCPTKHSSGAPHTRASSSTTFDSGSSAIAEQLSSLPVTDHASCTTTSQTSGRDEATSEDRRDKPLEI